jgi:hypothetical protein
MKPYSMGPPAWSLYSSPPEIEVSIARSRRQIRSQSRTTELGGS